MKNTNRIYLMGTVFLLFSQSTRCMDVPDPNRQIPKPQVNLTPKKAVTDPALHISIAKVNAELLHGVLTKNTAVVEVLLEIHADPNAKSQFKWTPLHFAIVSENDPQMIRLLLKYGAHVNARTENGNTPLDFTKSYPNEAVVQTLLAAKAIPSIPKPEEPTQLGRIMVGYAMLNRDSKRAEAQERKSRGKK